MEGFGCLYWRPQQRFALEPQDRTAIVGDRANLPCRVLHKAGTLQWTRDGFGLGSNRDLDGYPRYAMVGSEEEADFSLQIDPVTLEDDAVFQCQVGASNGIKGIRSRTAQFTVFVPPEPPQIIQGDYLKSTAGMTVELTCESNGGKPPAELRWLDGNGDEVQKDIEYRSDPLADGKRATAALKWAYTPRREDDGKNFTCRSENPALTQPLYARIRMEVKYPPEISLAADKKSIKVGEPVTFTCDVKANPSDVIYKWFRNDDLVVGDHRTTYTLPRVTRALNGETVSCEVTNSVGTSKATHTLDVEYGPSFPSEKSVAAADVGSDVTLTCAAEGNPKPDLVWTFEGNPNVLSTERTLKIADVRPEHAGRYACKASVPEFPPKTAVVILYIKGPPRIVSTPVQLGTDQETIELECAVRSVPPPTKVMWFRHERHVDSGEDGYERREERTEDGVLSRLIKHHAAVSDFGLYNCTVWNDFGYDSVLIAVQQPKNIPVLMILAAVVGGVVVVVFFTIIIILCLRKKAVIKDEEYSSEKKTKQQQQQHVSDSGSSGDSDLKAEIRTSSRRPQQRFALEPQDRTAIVGDRANLPCRVLHKAGTLQWTRDGFGLGSNRDLDGYPRYAMVGSEEEADFSLQIDPVTLEDDAVFQCQVGASNGIKGIRSRTAQFTVFVPPEPPQIIQGDYLKSTAGMTVELTCESNGGKPPAELRWLDGNGDEVQKDIEYRSDPLADGKRATAALKWAYTPRREDDGKNFTCRSENPALTQPLYARIRMEVKYPPEISLAADKKSIKVGEPVTFTCDVKANPSDVIYKWFRNDDLVVGDHRTTYTLPRVTRALNGETVSCEVTNSVGTSKATHTLDVEYGPSFPSEKSVAAADVGSDVTLTCAAEGNPKPDLVWTFEGNPNVLSTERTLKIADVRPEHAGRYACKASVPEFPPKTAVVILYIKGPPRIVSTPVQLGTDQETIELECAVRSVPPPTKVMWFRHERHVDSGEDGYERREERTEDGVLSRLIKHHAAVSDFGLYNCTVWNDFGYDSVLIAVQQPKNIPVLMILAAVVGGVVVVVFFTIIIILCLRKKAVIKDEEYSSEKKTKQQQQQHVSDSGSSGDSDLKAEIRTSSSLSNPAERSWTEEDKYSVPPAPGDFPPKSESQSNNGYIPYVDYTRDYNPPLGASRDSGLYGNSLTDLTLDPRYRAAYANPYLRGSQATLPIPPAVYVTSTWSPGTAESGSPPNHYITTQQTPLKPGTLATHV
ncbi:KIRREL [Cordylochernes scorpioides]|uniref:KIRREL n=1 Tax=Cordylochernes scorpioides TaxID=51811 RepID=A0ABY6LPJ5_9ARAC|nr:KIRREL [Cordylochernes scorpioides]